MLSPPRNSLLTLILIGCWVLLISVSACTPTDESQRRSEVKALLAIHNGEEQFRRFQAHSHNEQIDLYLTGMQMKPPVIGLAYFLAAQGDKIIPTLLGRLAKETNEMKQQDLIFAFRVIAVQVTDCQRRRLP